MKKVKNEKEITKSCTTSNPAKSKDDPDMFYTVDLLTSDQVGLNFASDGHVLYYYSDIIDSPIDNSMGYNYAHRYSVHKQWDVNDELKIGDVFFFSLTDFHALESDPKKLASIQDMYHSKGVILAMEGGFEKDFERVCNKIQCYNPYKGQADKLHLPDEKPLWIFAGTLPSLASYNLKLVPSHNSKRNFQEEAIPNNDCEALTYMNDYLKGQACDLAVASIQKSLEKPLLKDGTDELTKLVGAHRINIPGTQRIQWKGGDKDYDKTNCYQMEILVWNAYSENENRNYYLIHQELIFSFQNAFVGEYHSDWWLYKEYGFCGTQVECWFQNRSESNDIVLHVASPGTTQQVTTYTSSLSYNLGGKIGISNNPSLDISGGITMGNSKSYSVGDINISNVSQPNNRPIAKWQFHLREPSYHCDPLCYGWVNVDPGSQSGRETFTGGTDFIFSIPQGYSSEWQSGYEVTVVLNRWYDVMNAHDSKPLVKKQKYELSFTLPVVK